VWKAWKVQKVLSRSSLCTLLPLVTVPAPPSPELPGPTSWPQLWLCHGPQLHTCCQGMRSPAHHVPVSDMTRHRATLIPTHMSGLELRGTCRCSCLLCG
jgi:hypothetical protein